jgi:hypothetical protein
MFEQDIFHGAVQKALEKEDWMITHNPMLVRLGGFEMSIHLGAEKIIGAEKGREKIAVAVKNFLGTSTISEFHIALGQFINYRFALEEQDPDRKLYLAIPFGIYRTFFGLPFVQGIVQRYEISLIIYDPEHEVIL